MPFTVKNIASYPISLFSTRIDPNRNLDLLTVASAADVRASILMGDLFYLMFGKTLSMLEPSQAISQIGLSASEFAFLTSTGIFKGMLGAETMKHPFRFNADGYLMTSDTNGLIRVQGVDADGAAVTGDPVLVGGVDNTGLVQQILVGSDGSIITQGVDADGAAVTGNPVLVGGVDKNGLVQQILVGSDGAITVSDGSVGSGNNIWTNPQDFTATANAGTMTITFAAFTSTILSSVIASINFAASVIKRRTATGVADILPVTSVVYAANVLTLADMDAAFAVGDEVFVFVPGPDKAYEQLQDAQRVGGHVADDAADAGNPVKAGGVYLSDWFANLLDAGDVGNLLLDEIRALVTRSRAYDPTTDSDKNVPVWSHLDAREPQPLIESVNNVNANYLYYLEMDGFTGWSVVMDFVSTLSVAGIATVTVWASNDEGLTPATADYIDVTNLLFSVASVVIPAAAADTDLVLDPNISNPGYRNNFKYIQIRITTSGLAGAGQIISWAGYAQKTGY